MRFLSAALAALLLTAILAACGSSASSTTTSTGGNGGAPVSPSSSTATTVATVTKTATTTASGASSSTSTSAGEAPCRAAGLAISFLGQQGATGHGELGFALRNTGNASCSTIGYPGVQFLDRAGNNLPTTPTHTTQDFFGTTVLHRLSVAPGATVSFRLGVTHGAGSSAGCTTAYAVQVIPPNDTSTLKVSIPDGAAECGTTTVSPLTAGNAAFTKG
jgi:hypothetical protein